MFTRLKEMPLNQACREIKKQYKKIGLIAGIRLKESNRRALNYKSIEEKGYDKRNGKNWINPILHWTDEDKNQLINSAGLPKNPVYQYLCKSGECLCGAFAKKGELLELEMHYPEEFTRIQRLYDEVKNQFPWQWDEEPIKSIVNQQRRERKGQLRFDLDYSPLCHDCINNSIED